MVRYGFPSRELYVVGVTGTSGKSSTVAHLRAMLTHLGYRVGSLSTVDMVIGNVSTPNTEKMTMVGRGRIQKALRQMANAGCDVAIIETSSQGITQHRHRGILYDAVILTNLYPEHIEAHGSYEAYRETKSSFFRYVATSHRKRVSGLRENIQRRFVRAVPKVCVVNADIALTDVPSFFSAPFDETYLVHTSPDSQEVARLARGLVHDVPLTQKMSSREGGMQWRLGDTSMKTTLRGAFEPLNISLAAAFLYAIHEDVEAVARSVEAVSAVPGRIEEIPEARVHGFTVIVDYAFEPVAVAALYESVALHAGRILHVLGSTGGGRDRERRFTVGELVGKKATKVFITNEDPYDDDPLEIMHDVAKGVTRSGKTEENGGFVFIPDRHEAIVAAIREARPGDLILITGKGSESAMVVKGKLVPFDDRAEVRAALASLEK